MLALTSKVGSITEAGCHLAILVDHIQYAVLDEVHLSTDGTTLGDVIPGEKHVKGHPSDYGCDKCFACRGKEWDHSDQILAGVV